MSIPRHIGQAIVLAIIFAILAAQAAQLAIGFVYRGKLAWPIVTYPMYRTPHYDQERLDHDWKTFVTFEDGRRMEVDREELAMGFWLFYKNVVNSIIRGNSVQLEALAAHYCGPQQGGRVTLEVEDLGVAIGRNGPVFGLEPETLARLDIPCPDPPR